jgi:protocatechuate 3,4-dioxygenase beta subunit
MKLKTSGALTRRQAVEALGTLAGAALLAGCGSQASPLSASTSTTTSTSGTGTSTCAVTPTETEGPYPDRIGMLNNPTYLRRDITEGRSGLSLTLILTIVSAREACNPVANASVEIWQCDAAGHYSEYSQPGFDGTGQTFLRGVQTTDSAGQVTFATIFPGWYAGRATHIRVDVFRNGTLVKTTQIAFPESVAASVYSTGVYASKGQNPTTNTSDNVFSDGTEYEMATLSGSVSSGYTATLTVAISA